MNEWQTQRSHNFRLLGRGNNNNNNNNNPIDKAPKVLQASEAIVINNSLYSDCNINENQCITLVLWNNKWSNLNENVILTCKFCIFYIIPSRIFYNCGTDNFDIAVQWLLLDIGSFPSACKHKATSRVHCHFLMLCIARPMPSCDVRLSDRHIRVFCQNA